MTTHEHDCDGTHTHRDFIAIGVPAEEAENLAKILLGFEALVPDDRIDFPLNRTLWTSLAVTLLKASATVDLVRGGVPVHPFITADPAAAGQKLAAEVEEHLRQKAAK